MGQGSPSLSYVQIGRNIRRARKRLHMTQDQIAEALGISANYYRRCELGITHFSLDRLYQVSVLLSTPIESFFEGAYVPQEFEYAPPPAEITPQLLHLVARCSESAKLAMLQICEIISKMDNQ